MSFGFYLVNLDCSAYLAVDHGLVYSYSKMFLLFFRLIFSLIPVSKPPFLIHISVLFSFCVLVLDPAVELEICHQFSPASKSFLPIFDSR